MQHQVAGDEFQGVRQVRGVFTTHRQMVQMVLVQLAWVLGLPAILLSPVEQIDPQFRVDHEAILCSLQSYAGHSTPPYVADRPASRSVNGAAERQ
jgi:hypothetical protein